jgi:hypothetical protein
MRSSLHLLRQPLALTVCQEACKSAAIRKGRSTRWPARLAWGLLFHAQLPIHRGVHVDTSRAPT